MQQLRHLRASNQLAGLHKILDTQQDPVFLERFRFVRAELAEKLKDPAFVADYDNPHADWTRHPELYVCGYFEQMGNYMKWGLVDESSLLDQACDVIVVHWRILSPVIERIRAVRGEAVFDNFEYLTARAQAWIARYPNGNYPRGTPHVELYTAALKR